MKRFLFILSVIFISTTAFAQFSDKVVESKYYQVYFQENEKEAALIAQKLDAYFNFYNNYFHFDTSIMKNRLKVKILDSKAAYIDYVSTTTAISAPVSSFLFIQYKDASKSELIGYCKDNSEFEDTLSHYSFIQFFRNFITNPPLWIEKGFAVYFGKSFYSSSKNAIVYKENLTWLNTLKSFLDSDPPSLIDLNTLFAMSNEDVLKNSDLFYAQSWGLVKFLIENQQAVYNRVVWDSINKLRPDATKEENEQNAKQAFAWLDSARFSKDFYEYITALKTFPQLVDSGIALYEKEEYSDAKIALIKAIAMEDKNYIPYYYLGLIHYNTEDYAMADFYYNSAIQMNGDKAICYYALGVNAFAEQNYEKSIKCLKTAVTYSKEYQERCDKIIDNIRTILRLQNRTMDIDAIQPYPKTSITEEEVVINPDITIITDESEKTETPDETLTEATTEELPVKTTPDSNTETATTSHGKNSDNKSEESVSDTVKSPANTADEEISQLRLNKDTGEYMPVN